MGPGLRCLDLLVVEMVDARHKSITHGGSVHEK